MTQTTQDKLAKIREALIEAKQIISQDLGTEVNSIEKSLGIITELEEELKPKQIDVESIARALAFYHHDCELDVFAPDMEDDGATWEARVFWKNKAIVETERQKNES